MSEQVLVVKSAVIDRVGRFHGITTNVWPYFGAILTPFVPFFMLRTDAEENEFYKQIIPYMVIRRDGKYLCFRRGSKLGEKRLLGMLSLGFGGHINPVDAGKVNRSALLMYTAAVDREIREELEINAAEEDHIVAALLDQSYPAGRVHFGIVHLRDLGPGAVSAREEGIEDLVFRSPDEILEEYSKFEKWSQLFFDCFIRGEVKKVPR